MRGTKSALVLTLQAVADLLVLSRVSMPGFYGDSRANILNKQLHQYASMA